MAGGPWAHVMCCLKCGRRAERISEGQENDTYQCSAGHGYSVHWKQTPRAPLWPPSASDRHDLEVAAKVFNWDLAAIDAEIAQHTPSRPRAATPAPPSPPIVAPPRPTPAPLLDTVPRAREWLESELRKMSSGWWHAKRDHAGDDWEDFALYKANARYSDELLRRFVTLDVAAFRHVRELADALDALVEAVQGDADYGSAQSAERTARELAERVRRSGAER